MSIAAEDLPDIKDGKITLSFADYLRYVERSKQALVAPPVDSYVMKASYVGETTESHVTFDAEFEVVVINEEEWVQTQLLSKDVTVHTCESYSFSEDQETSSYFSVSSSGYMFVAKQGRYRIKARISFPYQSRQKKGFKMVIPIATTNNFDFTVNSPDLEVNVDTGLQLTHEQIENKTRVTGQLKPSASVSVQWVQKVVHMESDETTRVEEVKPMSIQSSQRVLHSIGDRLISTMVQAQYSIRNGSVASVALRMNSFGKHLRVLRVDGMHVKKWEVVTRGSRNHGEAGVEQISTGTDSDGIVSDHGRNSEPYKVIKVHLDRSVEGNYWLTVNTELELPSSTSELKLPSFSCMSVDRDRGHIAIEAKSSVEIKENNVCALGRIDKSELPRTLVQKATHPIIYTYKFLQRNHWADVTITKHEDVDVLVTCIDEGYFVATYGEGLVLHHMFLKVRNTQKQYLRVDLPSEASVWSVSVEGEPVKPSADNEGKLLIPLKQTSSANSAAFLVEAVFIDRSVPFVDSGDMTISFAKFDIPINHLFVSVFVPKNAQYGEFTGSIKEVTAFSKNPATIQYKPPPYGYGKPFQSQVRQRQVQQSQVQRNIQPQIQQISNTLEFDEDDAGDFFVASIGSLSGSESEEEEEEEAIADRFASIGGTLEESSGLGVLPVKVDNITVGKEFRFEKILASSDERICLSVPFKKTTKGFFAKRRTYNLKLLLASGAISGGLALSYALFSLM